MGKAKRYNPYDEAVRNQRARAKSFGETRQKFSGINSSFLNSPLQPPITNKIRGTGTGDGKFCSASLSANQTTNIGANDHVEFDTLDEDGGIVLQTGSGQADGIFELLGGKKYYLEASVRPRFGGSNGAVTLAWYDITNSAEIGRRAAFEAGTSTSDDANSPTISTIVTPSTNITAELRIIQVTNFSQIDRLFSHANIFEISLGGGSSGGGGGSGGIDFPITPTINDHGNVGTTTEDIDLSASNGHVHKITLTGDPTLTFSNPPSSGTQMEFEIEFVQDATGGRSVTFPASVAETITISSTASTTTIITFRTNDGGTTYHAVPSLRGGISLSGSFLPLSGGTMTGDISMGGNDITSIDNLKFATTGTQDSSASTIWTDASGDMLLNVATSDRFFFTINGTSELSMTATQLNLFNNNITDIQSISITGASGDTTHGRLAHSTGHFDIIADTSGDDIRFSAHDGVSGLDQVLTLDASSGTKGADFHDGILSNVTAINFTESTLTPSISSVTDDFRYNVGSGNIHEFQVAATTEYEFSATRMDLKGNYLEFTEISAPGGDPAANDGWLYVKDDGGTSALYFEDDSGTVTNVLTGSWIGTATSNLDMENNSIVDIDQLVITGSTGDTNHGQLVYASGNFDISALASGDIIRFFTHDGVSGSTQIMTLDASSGTEVVRIHDATLDQCAAINFTFTSATPSIFSLADSLVYNVGSGESHNFTVAGTTEVGITATAVEMNGNNLNNVGDIKTNSSTSDIGTEATPFNSLYLDNTLFINNLKEESAGNDINVHHDLDIQTGATVDFADTTASASAGTNGDVPSQVVGYITVKINGISRKVPFYAT